MHFTFVAQILALALLATPLISGLPVSAPTDSNERYVTGNTLPVSLAARHHTKAQIAAKTKAGRDLTQDEIEEDEDDALLTTLAPGGEIEKRHHTKAQIAAKAKAGRDVEEREAHHTKAQIAAKTKAGRDVEEREAHHTKAQVRSHLFQAKSEI
jgi:hypothetical protein